MPFEELVGICRPPSNLDAPIWRFMSLAKFMDILLTRALFFSNLAFAEDPYDGVPVGGLERHWLEISSSSTLRGVRTLAREGVCVSCWHLSEYEPAGMWKLYAASDAGIALRTTYRALQDSLHLCPTPVYLGLVRYDADTWAYRPLDANHTLTPAMLKRRSFEHEREVRAISRRGAAPDSPGHHIEVDLDVLAPEVIVSPAAPTWSFEVVQSVMTRLGYNWPARHSDLLTLASVPETLDCSTTDR